MRAVTVVAMLATAACQSAAQQVAHQWTLVVPSGGGAFEDAWQPNRWPMGTHPIAGPSGQLWMVGIRTVGIIRRSSLADGQSPSRAPRGWAVSMSTMQAACGSLVGKRATPSSRTCGIQPMDATGSEAPILHGPAVVVQHSCRFVAGFGSSEERTPVSSMMCGGHGTVITGSK